MNFYHIVYRSENNLKFFKTDEDYISYWDMLLFCLDKYNIKILAAGLMTNHIHLFLNMNEKTMKGFLLSLVARQRNYLIRIGRLNKGERSTVKNGFFSQSYSPENKKAIRANIIYVNRNYYKKDQSIDIYVHPSSAIPLIFAAVDGQYAYSNNIFSRFLDWEKYYDVVDLKTLKLLFGNATEVLKNSLINDIISTVDEIKADEDVVVDPGINLNEIIETFLKQVPNARFYKSRAEKITHLSEKNRIRLVKVLLENGISNRSQIANIIKVSNASVYRYIKKINKY